MNFLRRIFKKRKHDDIENKIDKLIKQNNDLLTIIKNQSQESIDNSYLNNDLAIKDFEIRRNNIGIRFEAISSTELINRLPQIHLTKEDKDNIEDTLSNIIGGVSNVTIAGYATQGLFKATVNPETLMKLSSGGLSSSVVNGGKITKQAGFIPAGSTILTPMIIFQISSIITGQYYMHNISKQLNNIQEKIDELLNLFHIERQAKLVKSFQFITENLNKSNFVLEDFLLIKMILSELTDIREEYFLMLDDSVKDIRKKLEYESISSLKEAKYITSEFEKIGFIFKMKTSLIADELFNLAKITEFHMNLCYKKPDINRLNLLTERLLEFSKFKLEDLSFNKTDEFYQEIKEKTLCYLSKSKKEAWANESKIEEIEKSMNEQFIDFEDTKNHKLSSIAETYGELIKPFYEEKDIIIDNRTSNVKLYMK